MTREVWRYPRSRDGLDPLLDPLFDEIAATGPIPVVDLGPRHVTRPTERGTAVKLATIRKALVAGVGALSASLVTGGADGALSGVDWTVAAVAALSVGWVTWKTENAPAVPVPPDAPAVDEHA